MDNAKHKQHAKKEKQMYKVISKKFVAMTTAIHD